MKHHYLIYSTRDWLLLNKRSSFTTYLSRLILCFLSCFAPYLVLATYLFYFTFLLSLRSYLLSLHFHLHLLYYLL